MKVFYLSVLLLTFSITVHAQRARIGITGNPQFSWFNSKTESVKPEGFIVSFNSRFEFDFFFAENYAFSTGIAIENLGGKSSYEDIISFKVNGEQKIIPAGTTLKYRMQYLGIPLGLKLKTQQIGYSTLFFNPGLTPLVNIRSRVYNTSVFPDKSNAKSETRFLNLEYFFCLGLEYSLGGNTALIGGFTFSSGFMDVTSRSADKIFTRSLGFKTGILF